MDRTPTDEPFADGRDGKGRFSKGNAGGPGNPHARRVAELRSVLLAAVTAEDLAAVVAGLVQRAKSGDVAAVKVLLDRIFGPPEAPDKRRERERKQKRERQRDASFDEFDPFLRP